MFINDGAVYVVSGDMADYNLNSLIISADSNDAFVRELKINGLKTYRVEYE